MTHIKIRIIFIFLLAAAGIQAQQYQVGLEEGKRMYEAALKLKNDGNCIEALPRFTNAYNRFQATRRYKDANNDELSTWEKRCIDGMIECNAPLVNGVYVHLSSQILSFTEKGEEQFITVTTNAPSWRVNRNPAWTTTRQSNNRLYVTCKENTEPNSRKDVIVISADGRQFEFTIEQTGKISCYQSRLNECKSLFNDALNLKESGRCDEAVRQFLVVFREIRAIRSECRDIPADHELDGGEERCINAIRDCGFIWKSDGDTYSVLSSQSLSFDAKGGEQTITVMTDAREWRVSKNAPFCTAQQVGNRLMVTCNENTGTNLRKDVLIISAGTQQFGITVEQAGGAIVAGRQQPVTESNQRSDGKETGKKSDDRALAVDMGLGFKAGLNLSTISNGTSSIHFSPAMKIDFHVGAFFNLRFGNKDKKFLGFQPELLYSRQGFAVDGSAVEFQYFTAAFMPRLYEKGIYFEVGPWLSYLFAVKPDLMVIDKNRISLIDLKGGKDAGVAAGAGYEFKFGLVAGARYMFGLSNMANNLLWKNRVITVSLGYKF